ncbi:hypothetical protein [Ketobacter alkanivorans]|nr:hypothetical protein [Ketobacter alkanivorans]
MMLFLLASYQAFAEQFRPGGNTPIPVDSSFEASKFADKKPVFKLEEDSAGIGLWKGFILVLVCSLVFGIFIALKPKIFENAPEAKGNMSVVGKKTISHGVVAVHIKVSDVDFLVVKDASGHTVTKLKDASNKVEEYL